ncbi:hypothetical protein FA95DRAFT_1678178 [Auriscalpium vulgare]|uniref:Uncharacterized protein n=1 Tax=Auriscalpium vulgare TaxID=40419 RepID=A0ACB8RXC1_9AGAM|nr:hypothetical protein FA95DRAFT_1678178 [Auriscalpium vulgare]
MAPLRTAARADDRFALSDSDSDEGRSTSAWEDPFDAVDIFGDGFFDAGGNQILFSAGPNPLESQQQTHLQIHSQIDDLTLYNHTLLADGLNGPVDDRDDPLSNDATVADIIVEMQTLGIDEGSDSDEDIGGNMPEDRAADAGPEWAPHGSKAMFMLDLLDNLPRLRLSDDHLKTFIWVMRECGTPNVPSFSALRAKQAELLRAVDIRTCSHVSAMENRFYMNPPSTLLALDWANPLVREHIQLYSEITTSISEAWQAGKWAEEPDARSVAPMWADWEHAPHRHYYVDELARLQSGQFVIPIRWFCKDGQDHADVYDVDREAISGCFSVRDNECSRRVRAAELEFNWLDIAAQNGVNFSPRSNSWSTCMPHPVRAIALGRPVFTLHLVPWSDDVSGNVTKQFNPHLNVYLVNGNIPHQKLAQEYFTRFCATSPHADSLEQMAALADDIGPERFHSAFDCKLEWEILFNIIAHLVAADDTPGQPFSGETPEFWHFRVYRKRPKRTRNSATDPPSAPSHTPQSYGPATQQSHGKPPESDPHATSSPP